ncbi:MAG TPA: PPOX class F420-dependent oxidoreductase [Candidatus Saccharimonadales bacterium]|nr:PPOX class F420-dependent oxidoreductase [Candidatus Saccharimonadales bacterium]
MTTRTPAAGAERVVPLPTEVRAFLEGMRYATLATINRDGSPHQTVTWYLLDGDTVVVNSLEGRRWSNNLRRDPRLSLAVEGGLRWVSLRGTVEILDGQTQAQADIAAMARRYNENGTAEQDIEQSFSREQRVSFRLRPSAIHAELGGA